MSKNQENTRLKNLEQKGITLIALVVTIIVLLILAGISISMLSGDNSILNQAGRARDITGQKDIEERIKLSYGAAMTNGLGDTTKEKFEKELKNEFGEDNVADLADDLSTVKINGKEYETGVSGGGGDTTPTTIAEAKSTSGGTVIALSDKDTTTLQDDLGNEVKVPKGFGIATDSGTKVEEGIVIEDVSHTETKGSQFVWVPVGEITKTDGAEITITLGRYYFDNPSNGTETPVQAQTRATYIATTESSAIDTYFFEFKDDAESRSIQNGACGNTNAKNLSGFIESAIKNGGYYIARYEAGINADKDQYAYANCSGDGTSLTYGNSSKKIEKDGSIKPLSIKGKGIWNAVTQPEAAIISRNMYTDLNSDLINSYAWDTAIAFIEKCGTNGDYANKTDGNGTLKISGNNSDEQCKICDMAGNVGEWTTETHAYIAPPCVGRGSNYKSTYEIATGRGFGDTSDAWENVGFRPLLYL